MSDELTSGAGSRDHKDEEDSALGARGLQAGLLSADSRARSLAPGLEGQNLS